MPQKNPPRCFCRQCEQMRKEGKVLHRRLDTRWDTKSNRPDIGYVSDYIPAQKLKSGRARKEREPKLPN